MRSARIFPALYRQTLPPRALVRGQRPAGMQGETLEIEIEIERGRPQDAAQRNRDTGRYYLLEAVMMPWLLIFLLLLGVKTAHDFRIRGEAPPGKSKESRWQSR
jgi:hypothetical protein